MPAVLHPRVAKSLALIEDTVEGQAASVTNQDPGQRIDSLFFSSRTGLPRLAALSPRLIDPVASEQIHISAWNSTKIAIFAVLGSLFFAVPASYGMARIRARLANSLEPILLVPLVLPSLVYGITLLIIAVSLGFRPSVPLVVASHLIVFGPLMYRTTVGIVFTTVISGKTRKP